MKAIILSISSDIGGELSKRLFEIGYEIYGTYNTKKPVNEFIKNNSLKFNVRDYDSKKYKNWLKSIGNWDLFISCVGTQDPIGKFTDVNLNEWVEGIAENSTYQIASLMQALKYRSKEVIPNIIFFAGGGTNSATPFYSAYTLGKISLIKAIELLDDEIDDSKFSIIGPGWVKTKIHHSTLNAKEKAGDNYYKTLEMINTSSQFNSIEKVIDDIIKIISLPKELVGGRNFSSVNDELTIKNLKRLKLLNENFYKLRRKLNNQ